MGLLALRMPRSDVEEPRRSAMALGMFGSRTLRIFMLWIEDGQDRQTQLFQRVDGLVEDRHMEYCRCCIGGPVSREAWAYSVGLSSVSSLWTRKHIDYPGCGLTVLPSKDSIMTN
ncbi:hypothetical protein Tco_0874183 [Tanacetum coccineum]|uniref:Uncharacterized protein n=1 Tax=Tanacetum coccineum TaxID=301880 RepID=A0ABQ5BNV2_9ASTR